MTEHSTADLPTIITVTYGTWATYTKRLIEQFLHFVKPEQYAVWVIADNGSADKEELMKLAQTGIVPKLKVVSYRNNISDLPRYNVLIKNHVRTKRVIAISTDCRIFPNTVKFFTEGLDQGYHMIGLPGPKLQREHADPDIGGTWHWVPKLLVDRGLEFDNTEHIQTHCFATDRDAFLDVGGFWTPDDGGYLDKGNLIAGEIYYSVKLRRAGYKLGPARIPVHHYGNGFTSVIDIDKFDDQQQWERSWAPLEAYEVEGVKYV